MKLSTSTIGSAAPALLLVVVAAVLSSSPKPVEGWSMMGPSSRFFSSSPWMLLEESPFETMERLQQLQRELLLTPYSSSSAVEAPATSEAPDSQTDQGSSTDAKEGALSKKESGQVTASNRNLFTRYSSPRYEITEDESKFQISLDVPGVKQDDVKVTLEENGKVLSISGHREMKKDGYSFSSRFSKAFSVDTVVDINKITADLSNGVLVVSAPKDLSKLQEKTRSIPISVVGSTTVKDEDLKGKEDDASSNSSATAVEEVSEDKAEKEEEKSHEEENETIDL